MWGITLVVGILAAFGVTIASPTAVMRGLYLLGVLLGMAIVFGVARDARPQSWPAGQVRALDAAGAWITLSLPVVAVALSLATLADQPGLPFDHNPGLFDYLRSAVFGVVTGGLAAQVALTFRMPASVRQDITRRRSAFGIPIGILRQEMPILHALNATGIVLLWAVMLAPRMERSVYDVAYGLAMAGAVRFVLVTRWRLLDSGLARQLPPFGDRVRERRVLAVLRTLLLAMPALALLAVPLDLYGFRAASDTPSLWDGVFGLLAGTGAGLWLGGTVQLLDMARSSAQETT